MQNVVKFSSETKPPKMCWFKGQFYISFIPSLFAAKKERTAATSTTKKYKDN